MSKVYVISDPHFGHHNIAVHRGFASSQEMDEHIISRWNKAVKKRDIVWLLGDITMEKGDYSILDRLNGLKKVVLGNHDKPSHVKNLLNYVNSVSGIIKYKGFWLSHCPIHPTELRGRKNIHGHIHENTVPDDRYINVSCERVDYTPVLFEIL